MPTSRVGTRWRIGGGWGAEVYSLFCRSLERLGIHYTRNDHKNVSIARAPSVARLDEFVGPKR